MQTAGLRGLRHLLLRRALGGAAGGGGRGPFILRRYQGEQSYRGPGFRRVAERRRGTVGDRRQSRLAALRLKGGPHPLERDPGGLPRINTLTLNNHPEVTSTKHAADLERLGKLRCEVARDLISSSRILLEPGQSRSAAGS